MHRPTAVLVTALAVLVGSSSAGDWAVGGFDALDHDFGTVRRGARLSHPFVFSNRESQMAHIRRVRVSCNCVQAEPAAHWIAPGESTTINAVMETSGFQGTKSVTITVQFDRPGRSEVALRVHCASAADLASGNHEVDFGVVPAGGKAEKKMHLDYTGEPGWKVLEVLESSPHLDAEVREVSRESGRVRYELKLSLRQSAPPGLFEHRLCIKTNDRRTPDVFVVAKANVKPKIAVSPDELRLEGLVPGEQVHKSLIIKANKPFRIVRVDHTDGLFEVRSSPTPKTAQLVVITLTVPEDTSIIPTELGLVTDLEEDHVLSVPVTVLDNRS